jgi:hypothetical protein
MHDGPGRHMEQEIDCHSTDETAPEVLKAGAPSIILEFLRWLDSESIFLAGDGGPGELVECGRSHSELVTEFMSRGDRSHK